MSAPAVSATSWAFQSLLSDRLDRDLSAGGINLDKSQIQQIDGLVAGSQPAREAISKDSETLADQVEAIASGAFTYALGNSIRILVGIAAAFTVLTWWLIEPKTTHSDRSGSGPSQPDQHEPIHRQNHFGGFHL